MSVFFVVIRLCFTHWRLCISFFGFFNHSIFSARTQKHTYLRKKNSIGLEVKTKYQPLTLKKLIVLYESVSCDYRSGSKIVLLKIVMIVKGNLRFFICWDVW